MHELLGPGATERWMYWKSRSKEQVSSHQTRDGGRTSSSLFRESHARGERNITGTSRAHAL